MARRQANDEGACAIATRLGALPTARELSGLLAYGALREPLTHRTQHRNKSAPHRAPND